MKQKLSLLKSEIVVGIDSSTTATKAIAWDFSGKNNRRKNGIICYNRRRG